MQLIERPTGLEKIKELNLLPAYRRQTLGWSEIVLLVIICFLAGAALLGPFIWPWNPLEQNINSRLQNPTFEHPFGTDQFGRDTLSRILEGSRWSLGGALIVSLGTNLIGFLIGSLAATSNTWVDNIIGRIIESFMALPGIVPALALAGVLGPSFPNLLMALVLTNWPWYARTYRSFILKQREAPYLQGAEAIGVGRWGQLWRHILPNIIGPSVIIATTNFGSIILNLSALSFIGLGMQAPTPEWGVMLNEARAYFQRYPWQMLVPGLCIVFVVLVVNLTGNALRDRLDPRLKGK